MVECDSTRFSCLVRGGLRRFWLQECRALRNHFVVKCQSRRFRRLKKLDLKPQRVMFEHWGSWWYTHRVLFHHKPCIVFSNTIVFVSVLEEEVLCGYVWGYDLVILISFQALLDSQISPNWDLMVLIVVPNSSNFSIIPTRLFVSQLHLHPSHHGLFSDYEI